ncbi:hypothetical protein V8B97DRAFT_1870380 [Scleroderma yunnanense]
MDNSDMPLDPPAMELDEPVDARWVPSQTSHPELQALIKQAEQDKLSKFLSPHSTSLTQSHPGRPAIPSTAEPLWTHTLLSTTSTLWSSTSTAPSSTSRTPSLFVDTSSSLLEPSSSDPSSSSSSSRRIKPYPAHVHRQPHSASINQARRLSSKQEVFAKRPRSSSHSTLSAATESSRTKGTKTLADREQDPSAAAFLALLRDVSRQMDENARKKQKLAVDKVKERDQLQNRDGRGDNPRPSLVQYSGTVPKQDKGKGKEDRRISRSVSSLGMPYDLPFNDSTSISNSFLGTISQPTEMRGGKTSNTSRNVDTSQGHSGQSILMDTTSPRSRNLTRVSSMDPNVPSRHTLISDSRNLTGTSSSSTIPLISYPADTAPLMVNLTSDDGNITCVQGPVQGAGRSDSREYKTHGTMSADESFMAIDLDINSGCNTDTDVDMDIPVADPNESSRSKADNAKPPSTTQQQSSNGQGRWVPHRRPQLGMRRAAVLPSNTQCNATHSPPSQYSIPSQLPKSTTVPRFKPPLLSTPAVQKAPAQKASAGNAFTRPQVGSVASGARDTQDTSRCQEGHARRQSEMSRLSSDTDPDSSFDVSFDLDMDVLEEAMRPYD